MSTLGINSFQPYQTKRRGKRCGRRKPWKIDDKSLIDTVLHIPVLMPAERKKKFHDQPRKSNLANLIPLCRETYDKPNVSCWNAHSIRNQSFVLCEHIMEKNIDIMFIIETWLHGDNPVAITECTTPGYTFLNVPHAGDCHGAWCCCNIQIYAELGLCQY